MQQFNYSRGAQFAFLVARGSIQENSSTRLASTSIRFFWWLESMTLR